MKIAIMQPYFFPYVGYFHLLDSVDTFVFYDDVHFIKKGWIHRNNILFNEAPFLFSIPCVKPSQNKLIMDTLVRFDMAERELFLKRIRQSYSKSPYFSEFFPLLEHFILTNEAASIAELAAASVKFVSKYLGMNAIFKFSSQDFSETRGQEKEERLISISKKANASHYHNAIGGADLYQKSSFKKHGLLLGFVKSHPIKYSQQGKSFVPWLSIIDVLMFNSKDATLALIRQYEVI